MVILSQGEMPGLRMILRRTRKQQIIMSHQLSLFLLNGISDPLVSGVQTLALLVVSWLGTRITTLLLRVLIGQEKPTSHDQSIPLRDRTTGAL